MVAVIIKSNKTMKILIIITLLTLSSCMVSKKVFNAKIDEMQKQIDSKLPRYEFEMKERLIREAIKNIQEEIKKD
jgi:hypothetical protein